MFVWSRVCARLSFLLKKRSTPSRPVWLVRPRARLTSPRGDILQGCVVPVLPAGDSLDAHTKMVRLLSISSTANYLA